VDPAKPRAGLPQLQLRARRPARRRCQHRPQAVALAQQLSDPTTEVAALNTLAEAHRLAGDHRAASQRHSDALTLATQLDDAEEQTRARQGLALLSDAQRAELVPLAASNPTPNSLKPRKANVGHRLDMPTARVLVVCSDADKPRNTGRDRAARACGRSPDGLTSDGRR